MLTCPTVHRPSTTVAQAWGIAFTAQLDERSTVGRRMVREERLW